jgi:CRISPR/Cas system-associated exonuclease Cas4 (RecB family)
MTPIIVSFSEIYKWQTCRRQFYYRFVLKRKPIEESDAVQTGIKGHRLMQIFYECLRNGMTKEEALKITHEEAAKMLRHDSFDGSLLKAWTLVDNYIRDNEFTADSFLVEERFLVPASRLTDDPELANVQIGFTPDVGFKRKGGFIDIEDYKFVHRAWTQKKIDRFPQLKLYQLFLETTGLTVSRTVLRFFNVTTGKIKAIPYTMDAAEKAVLAHDFLSAVKELVQFKTSLPYEPKKLPRTMNYTNCQYCDFAYVCGLEARGKDASRSLENMYKKSDYDYSA